jgi:hypothetical protein
MIAAFEIARLFRHDLTIFARGSQVALAMENIAAGNVTPSAFAVMRLRSSDLHFFTRKRTSRAITVPRRHPLARLRRLLSAKKDIRDARLSRSCLLA